MQDSKAHPQRQRLTNEVAVGVVRKGACLLVVVVVVVVEGVWVHKDAEADNLPKKDQSGGRGYRVRSAKYLEYVLSPNPLEIEPVEDKRHVGRLLLFASKCLPTGQ